MWFRLYTEVIGDLKMRRLTPSQRWTWIAVLALAREANRRGQLYIGDAAVDALGIAAAAGVRKRDAEAAIEQFLAMRMLDKNGDGVLFVVKWSQRQFLTDQPRPKIPDDVRERVFMRDGMQCLECGTTEGLSVDHVIPRTTGGPDDESNYQTLCVVCNARKGNRDRQRRYRERHRDVTNNVTDPATSNVTDPATSNADPHPLAPSPPHPPNPTPPAPATKRARETPLPDDWQPTSKHRERAVSLALDCEAEARKFRAHAEANDRRLVRWNAGFTQWLEQAPSFGGTRSNVAPLRANDAFAALDRNDASAWSRNGGTA